MKETLTEYLDKEFKHRPQLKEAFEGLIYEMLDNLDYWWTEEAKKSEIRKNKEYDGSWEYYEHDSDKFRQEFAQMKPETFMWLLMKEINFTDCLKEVVESYAEETDLPDDAGCEYEPDFDDVGD